MIAIFGSFEKKESILSDFIAIVLRNLEERSIFAAENKTNLTKFY